MEEKNGSEIQSYFNTALSDYTEYLATHTSSPCQHHKLIVRRDKKVQEHFIAHIENNE
jgi:hypothetical protein